MNEWGVKTWRQRMWQRCILSSVTEGWSNESSDAWRCHQAPPPGLLRETRGFLFLHSDVKSCSGVSWLTRLSEPTGGLLLSAVSDLGSQSRVLLANGLVVLQNPLQVGHRLVPIFTLNLQHTAQSGRRKTPGDQLGYLQLKCKTIVETKMQWTIQ